MRDTNLTKADLSNANLRDADVEHAVLKYAVMVHSYFFLTKLKIRRNEKTALPGLSDPVGGISSLWS
ncbi:pentapeptide repeat-containing protein [Amycolatopsis plumensis]|uniref:pentapeptide repeat-containing protein n=1 Tax=Amycolatopsis plumensis TaxID=236508 RepID=UPI00360F549C